MKSALLFFWVGCSFLAGLASCASAQKPEPSNTHTTSAAEAVVPSETKAKTTSDKTAAEQWAEGKVSADAKSGTVPKTDFDPLAMNDAVETSAIPRIEMTPPKELRAKGRGDLDASVALVRTESSVSAAVKKLTTRLGKPTWIENGSKHVWVAGAGASQCHRLVLDTDGSVEVETAAKSEWRMLAATASQNPCTGEIKRGIGK